jgi:hypothetical protein
MDVDKLLRSTEARVRLDLVAPAALRVDAPLRAPPGPGNPTLLAAAFGYLLRFDLARRHPHARAAPWVAEQAPARLESLAPDLAGTAAAVLSEARDSHAHFLRSADPHPEFRASMAAHALRLGRLDAAVRAGYVDARMAEADPGDVADLLAMLDAVPWDALGGAASLDLQPRFGETEDAPGADLLADGRLVLVRAPKTARLDPQDARRLVVLLILARAARGPDAVREVGIYFARHGHLWAVPVSSLVAQEAFPQAEAWVTKHAQRAARMAREAAEALAAPEDAPRPAAGRQKPPKWVKKRWFAPAGTAPAKDVGKAEQKKQRPDAAPRKSAPSRKPAPPRDAPPEGERKTRTPRPDWRKGSAWRRERGK